MRIIGHLRHRSSPDSRSTPRPFQLVSLAHLGLDVIRDGLIQRSFQIGQHVVDRVSPPLWKKRRAVELDQFLLLPVQKLAFADLPAVGRITISSPAVLRPFSKLNREKSYADQIKPFNFILTCHVTPLGHPPGIEPQRFHLISPYGSDLSEWQKKKWIDQYSGKSYTITTFGFHGDRHTARVKTYGDVIREYEFHAESKCADVRGDPCKKQTVGLLQPRHIEIQEIRGIGKESNSLEEVEAGLIHSPQNAYTEYPDPQRDEWQTNIVPALRNIPLQRLEKLSGMSRRALIYARVGRMRPHKKRQDILKRIVEEERHAVPDPETKEWKHALQRSRT